MLDRQVKPLRQPNPAQPVSTTARIETAMLMLSIFVHRMIADMRATGQAVADFPSPTPRFAALRRRLDNSSACLHCRWPVLTLEVRAGVVELADALDQIFRSRMTV